MLKKKNQLCVQIMLLFWLCKTLNGIVSWIHRQIFLEKLDEKKAGKWRLIFNLVWRFKVRFCEIIDVWTLLIQKRCVNGIH